MALLKAIHTVVKCHNSYMKPSRPIPKKINTKSSLKLGETLTNQISKG